MLFHCHNCCTKAPQCYFIQILPLLLLLSKFRKSVILGFRQQTFRSQKHVVSLLCISNSFKLLYNVSKTLTQQAVMTGQVSDYHHDCKHNIYVCSQNINDYILPFLKYANSSNNYLYTKKNNKANGSLIRIWWQIIQMLSRHSRVFQITKQINTAKRAVCSIFIRHIL